MENINILPSKVYLSWEDELQIVRASLTISDPFSIAIDILNTSENIVTGVYFNISFKDEFGQELLNGVEFEFSETGINISPKSIYYVKQFPLDERFTEARGLEARITKYTTSSGKLITPAANREKFYTLPIIPREKHDKMKQLLGEDIISYGENLIEAWRCVCGALNGKEVENCKNCNRSKILVLNNLTEPLINSKLISTMSKTGEFDKELTHKITKTLSSQMAQQTEKVNLARINENYKEGIKKFNTFSIGILLVLVILSSVFLYQRFGIDYIAKKNIKSVENFLEDGDYERAYEKLETLEFSDAEKKNAKLKEIEQLVKSNNAYTVGIEMKDKNPIGAISSFKEVLEEDHKNYRNAQIQITNLELDMLNLAQEKINEGSYLEAKSILTRLLEVLPESAKATNLKQSISEENTETSIPPEEGEGETVDEKDRSELMKKANALLFSYQKIKVKGGNLRIGPGLEYKEIAKLSLNSDVYIYEVKIEEDKRIWCRVEAKDFDTEEIYTGWISHKILEEQK